MAGNETVNAINELETRVSNLENRCTVLEELLNDCMQQLDKAHGQPKEKTKPNKPKVNNKNKKPAKPTKPTNTAKRQTQKTLEHNIKQQERSKAVLEENTRTVLDFFSDGRLATVEEIMEACGISKKGTVRVLKSVDDIASDANLNPKERKYGLAILTGKKD